MTEDEGAEISMLKTYPFNITPEYAKDIFCWHMGIGIEAVSVVETEESILYFHEQDGYVFQAVVSQEE